MERELVALNRAGRRKLRFSQRRKAKHDATQPGVSRPPAVVRVHISAGPSEKAIARILREYAA